MEKPWQLLETKTRLDPPSPIGIKLGCAHNEVNMPSAMCGATLTIAIIAIDCSPDDAHVGKPAPVARKRYSRGGGMEPFIEQCVGR